MQHNLSLFHLVREPLVPNSEAPVLFMLHGYGSNEQDLFSFAGELPPELFIISVRAPYPMPPSGYAWYTIHWESSAGKFSDDEQAIASRDKISDFIEQALETYPVDPNNVMLVGFSQGCILAHAVALSYPGKVQKVVGLSGYLNPDILVEGFEQNDFSGLSVYSSHGSADQVIPVSWARKTKPFLEKLGVDVEYSEFPVGHGVAPQNFQELKQWIESRL